MNTPRRLVARCAASFALASAGCSSSMTTTVVEPHPTIIQVDPLEFLGPLACGTGSGEVQRYVATLIDITEAGTERAPLNFELPSSAPARCEQSVAFGQVVPGHFYTARIDVYDRSDLVPLGMDTASAPAGSPAPVPLGTPILVEPATGVPVAPRWTTTCGTPCPQRVTNCPPPPRPVQAGATEAYNYAVRAEAELTQPMTRCWPWQNP